MEDEQLREAYSYILARRARAGRYLCVSPDDLLALVLGEAKENRRIDLLDHVMSCDSCRRDFEVLRALRVARTALK